MQNEVTTWNFGRDEVRTIMIDGEPWWVLKDVCAVLEIKNHNEVPDRLESDEVGRFELPHPQNPSKTLEMVCINESGLYSVILRSDKPQAKIFRRWITHEVLPSIRKTGSYSIPKVSPEFPSDDLIQMNQYLLNLVNAQRRSIASAQARMYQPNTYSVTQIANEFGFTAQDLNQKLASLGIQHKEDGQWILDDEYADCGYAVDAKAPGIDPNGNPCTNTYTKWTKAGREFIHERLRLLGYKPLCECTFIP